MRQAASNPSDPSMKLIAFASVNTQSADPSTPSHTGSGRPISTTGPAITAKARLRALRTANFKRSERVNRSSSSPSPAAPAPIRTMPARAAPSPGVACGRKHQATPIAATAPSPPPRGVGAAWLERALGWSRIPAAMTRRARMTDKRKARPRLAITPGPPSARPELRPGQTAGTSQRLRGQRADRQTGQSSWRRIRSCGSATRRVGRPAKPACPR